ncbi:MAG: nucleotidyltransferase family protein, partial [Clostridia bacterium]|nr:nucleotidyltransferase family protein [Clostridia bacterium]
MKISAIICEFNPFHNGHEYLISRAREINGCDKVVCVMSGSFTQRGDICRTDKFLRAKHAILCGADAVIELPAPFAVAPAEIFAQGAVKT